MKTYTNNTPGMRGITVNSGTGPYTHYLDAGASVELDPKLVIAVPDLGEPKPAAVDGDDADLTEKLAAETKRADDAEADLAAANATIADLTEKLAKFDADGDGKPGGGKAAEPVALTGKNKAELLDIAKAEGVEVEEGATNADIVSAIELHREAGAA